MQRNFTWILFFLANFLLVGSLSGQTQDIIGTVIDKETKQVLFGATVRVDELEPLIATTTDINGNFELKGVPLGRHTLVCEYLGYELFKTEGIIVSSSRIVDLEITMLQSALTINEVVISAQSKINAPVNELATVSTRSFSVDEANRTAAAVNDPGRMALSYAGVQQGGNDGENDIIVRANAPVGILWRLEGIDIPNPNHFARPGTSGGGTTIFSAQLLSRSDFSTGGMPAEYGNALSGAFDIKFRKGNNKTREHRVGISLLGLDFATEGPIQKGRSSYLANYRYSTLGILNNLGFSLVGPRFSNKFQDLSFNLGFKSKNNKHLFTVFGIGGLSNETKEPLPILERDSLKLDDAERAVQISNMGAIGTTYTYLVDANSYIKIGLAGIANVITFKNDVFDLNNNSINTRDEAHEDARLSASFVYSNKFNLKTRLKTGMSFNFVDYTFRRFLFYLPRFDDFSTRKSIEGIIDGSGKTVYGSAYAQVSYDVTEKIIVNAGINSLFLGLNNTYSIDPRGSVKFIASEKQSISFALGKYSQILPMANYFYEQKDTISGVIHNSFPNKNLEMMKSIHAIISYNLYLGNNWHFAVEPYYQYLYDIPVEDDETQGYYFLNTQSGVVTLPTNSGGTSTNIGFDLSVEKNFDNNFNLMVNFSFYDSKYELPGGHEFNTAFNSRFASNLTFGKEFHLSKGRAIQWGARFIYNGGFRYTPVDLVNSTAETGALPDYSRVNEAQVDPYFRLDHRLAYRFNGKRFSGIVSLDVQNILNTKNIRSVAYEPGTKETSYSYYPGGLIPVLGVKFDF